MNLRHFVRSVVFGRRRFQPLFILLRRAALLGLNYGADDPLTSGEAHVLERLAHVRRSRRHVVFDVGANVGTYAELVLAHVPDVELHCFEPSPPALARLREAVGSRGGVEIHPFGLGRADETVPVYSDAPASGLTSVHPRRLGHHDICIHVQGDVPLRRLDGVLEELGVTHVDLLKLDVEGHELAALDGAGAALQDGTIDAIQFEFGGAHIDARVFFQDFYYLLSPRYRLYRILRDGLAPIDRYHEDHEVFVTANYLSIRRGADF